MKLNDYISKSIQEFPSLYKDVDFEKSMLKVLDHVFFSIGNGMVFAQPTNPSDGGYITEPRFKTGKNGERKRLPDKPYDAEKYKKIPEGYFDDVIMYVNTATNPPKDIQIIGDWHWQKTVYMRFEKIDPENPKIMNRFGPRLMVAENTNPFEPYPISSNSIFWQVLDGAWLRQDWLDGLWLLCVRTLEYCRDPERFKNHVYFPTDSNIAGNVNMFQTYLQRGLEKLHDLQKSWGYSVSDNIPTHQEILAKKEKNWARFRREQIEMLERFVQKHNSNT